MIILNAAIRAQSLKTGTASEPPRTSGAVPFTEVVSKSPVAFTKLVPDLAPVHVDQPNCVPRDECDALVEERKVHGHHLFAALLICVMLTVNLSFAMATSKNKTLAKNT